MYAKLVFRNARRSAGDYLLYVATLIVLAALMMFSTLLAAASSQQGLQARSVPLIISMAMAALLCYINGYMLRHRAKEIATYILLGMNKGTMAALFFGESLLLGAAALLAGMALGSLCYLLALSFLKVWFPIAGRFPLAWGIAARDSLLYFTAVQALSLLRCSIKIRRLQIGALMSEGRANQRLGGKPHPLFWSALFLICVAADLLFLFFITGDNGVLKELGTNAILISMVLGIWSFYKSSFHWLAWLRMKRRRALYQGNRLYMAAQMLSKITSNILLHTVLSVCLLFSAIAFSCGLILPHVPGGLFSTPTGLWMSFAEICMCIVFIAIYFSVLAVQQVAQAKENHRALQIMVYLGKTKRQLKRLIKQEIILKYTYPAVICLLLLPLCAVPLNNFLNTFLLANNLLLVAIGSFTGCFLLTYAGYGLVAYRLCVKNA